MERRQFEALVKVGEECAEVQQEVAKILLHGPTSYNPHERGKGCNVERLARELGDLLHWVDRVCELGLVNPHLIQHWREQKGAQLNAAGRMPRGPETPQFLG